MGSSPTSGSGKGHSTGFSPSASMPGETVTGRTLPRRSEALADIPDPAFTSVTDVRYPGLDGLRGVAVALVVGFHLWPDVVRGGWLGVSLFFTLSGYLIIGLIDAEIRSTGRLRLGRFMARRVRRLLPAALLTISAAVALTALLTDQALRGVGIDALAAVLNVFNWHAATDPGGYAAIFEAASAPLEHFWSLAIEEQFYLIVPAVAALTRRPVPVVLAMSVFGLGGLVLWWGSPDAYVATPVRSLEIAAGAGLALLAVRWNKLGRLVRWEPNLGRGARLVSVMVVVLALAIFELSVAILRPSDDPVFRGFPQLMSLCWVILLVASLPGGPLERLLAAGPLRWLGTRSYAIYLFHWPLIELTDLGPGYVILLTLGLAELSYRLVEMPVRRRTGTRSVVVLAVLAMVVGVGAVAVIATSEPGRGAGERREEITELPAWLAESPTSVTGPAPTVTPAETVPSGGEVPAIAPDSSPPTSVPQPAPAGDAPRPPIVTVLGDSTAVHIADGLRRWADSSRVMAVVERAMAACSPVNIGDRPWMVLRTGDDANPRNLVQRDQPCRVHDIEPGTDIVLVVDHAMALVDHQRPDGSWASILDGDFAADLAESYRELASKARMVGARLVLTTAPRWLPLPDDPLPPSPPTDPNRTDAYNRLVHFLVAELETDFGEHTVGLLDTATLLDLSEYDGPYGRSDGAHVDFDRSVAFATDFLGPALLTLADRESGR